MRANEFYREFCAMFSDSKFLNTARECWRNRADFTNIIIPRISKILEGVGFSHRHQYEYYKIDLIGWQDLKQKAPVPPKIKGYRIKEHFWQLGVAVEHENDQTDWTDELVKLMYVNCPLRVVIGYIPEGLKREERAEVLAYASRVVTELNMGHITDGQEYMLILGENHAEPDKLSADTYQAYVYNLRLREFEQLF